MEEKKTFKLHELIEMARAGKKFRAISSMYPDREYPSDNFLGDLSWSVGFITTEWTVKPQPEVVEFEAVAEENVFQNITHLNTGYKVQEKLTGKRWKFVATEVIE